MAPLPPDVLARLRAQSAAPTAPAPVEPAAADEPSRWSTRPRVTGRRWWAFGVAVLLVAVTLAWYAARAPAPEPLTERQMREQVGKAVASALEQQQRAPAEASLVHTAIAPSLVLIRVGDGVSGGLGTGFVASAQGAILTAHHVVAGPGPIQVTFADGSTSPARVTSADAAHDVAVLAAQTPPTVVSPAVLRAGLRVGDRVYAVGHPLGLTDSITAGVVSATGRTVKAKDRTLEGLIQFDAAVNPGNSGGPLLNKSGQVVGIVTALANPGDQPYFIGIGFAVPIATAGGSVGAPAL